MNKPTGNQDGSGYGAWLGGTRPRPKHAAAALERVRTFMLTETEGLAVTAADEWVRGVQALTGTAPEQVASVEAAGVVLGTFGGNAETTRLVGAGRSAQVGPEGYCILGGEGGPVVVGAQAPAGLLYGVFHLLRLLGTNSLNNDTVIIENPANGLRMINQWDNADGSIERGYAGPSIFYQDDKIVQDLSRVRDYARLLASVGINAISINNVNVHRVETRFITAECLPDVVRVADVFREYGVKLFLSINYASPIELGDLTTSDPLDPEVQAWWKRKAEELYAAIPDLGGFLVKADSEGRPGPFTYGRDHADGSNMLAEAIEPFGGIVIWRCFVYNCTQDWRDRSTDRARAAYDHFKPLDGRFKDNVILQVKNGPIDFQVREPVSPLFGAMEKTNLVIEFQITQEYTGQQRHLCYLPPQWKEVLEFDTKAAPEGAKVKNVVDGSLYKRSLGGFAAVSNIGADANWTGHLLAQSNLYGFGRLAWNPELEAEAIAAEWAELTFGEEQAETIISLLMNSWSIYESYTAPLGVGFMVNPDHHYGPNVDGYEYSRWGTYHFADCHGIGVDRTQATGTGYTGQYMGSKAAMYESLADCPDELLLFFHHVPYTHQLHSGKTVIQHIYDTHFEGVERAEEQVRIWSGLESGMHPELFAQVKERLEEQARHSREWRDIINTYFYRKSGIADAGGRTIY